MKKLFSTILVLGLLFSSTVFSFEFVGKSTVKNVDKCINNSSNLLDTEAAAENSEDLEFLCHYTNLQPLWWRDNIIKKDKF